MNHQLLRMMRQTSTILHKSPTLVHGPTAWAQQRAVSRVHRPRALADGLVPPPITGGDAVSSAPSTSSRALPPLDPAVLEKIRQLGPRNKQGKVFLHALTFDKLEQLVVLLGEKPNKAKQLFKWVYANGHWIQNFREATGTPYALSLRFLDLLDSVATLDAGLRLEKVAQATDGTRKLVFRLTEGEGADKTIETVIIPMGNGARIAKDRYTLCVSSQVGCAQNCQFCFTGRMGLLANLLPNQIVGQMVEARRYLAQQQDPTPITHSVFMGQGEPMNNYAAMRDALRIMTSREDGLRLAKSNATVSSVGLLPEVERYINEEESLLAISLHATTDEVRNWIVPVNRRYPIADLMALLAKYFPAKPADGSKPEKFFVLEYVLLDGVNDSREDAQRLVDLTRDCYCIVNLICFNSHSGTQFKPSPRERMEEFKRIVKQGGKLCTIRESKGDDSMAACGQLGNLGQVERPAPILKVPAAFRKESEETSPTVQ